MVAPIKAQLRLTQVCLNNYLMWGTDHEKVTII